MFRNSLVVSFCIWAGLAGCSGATTVKNDVNFVFGTPYYGYNYDFDIDADGTDDLRLRPFYSSSSGSTGGGSSGGLTISGLNGTRIALGGPLAAGDTVDGALNYSESQSMIGYGTWWRRSCSWWYGCRSSSGENYFGAWTTGDRSNVAGFLGLELSGNRYGWVELDLRFNGAGTLIGHGYETVAGDAVAAGAETEVSLASATISPVPLPGTGLLLLGGLAALAVRRRM